MVFVRGRFSLQEARRRESAYIFALFDFGRAHLSPISQPNPDSTRRGITITPDRRKLTIDPILIPKKLGSFFVGIWLPDGHDFAEAGYQLQFIFPDGTKRVVHDPIADGAGMKFALLAVVNRIESGWNVGRTDPPELFANKRALAAEHPVPDWWLRLQEQE